MKQNEKVKVAVHDRNYAIRMLIYKFKVGTSPIMPVVTEYSWFQSIQTGIMYVLICKLYVKSRSAMSWARLVAWWENWGAICISCTWKYKKKINRDVNTDKKLFYQSEKMLL